MTAGWNISAPHLSDDEAAQALAPGGFGQAEPDDAARAVLLGLQAKPTLYGGTVSPDTVEHRRKRNRNARRARRINRRRS